MPVSSDARKRRSSGRTTCAKSAGVTTRDSTCGSAGRTALDAERVTGNRARGLRVLSAERLCAVGWQTQRTLFEEGPTDGRA